MFPFFFLKFNSGVGKKIAQASWAKPYRPFKSQVYGYKSMNAYYLISTVSSKCALCCADWPNDWNINWQERMQETSKEASSLRKMVANWAKRQGIDIVTMYNVD